MVMRGIRSLIFGGQGGQQPAQTGGQPAGASGPAAPATPAPAPLAPNLAGNVNVVLDGYLTAIGYIVQSGQNISAVAHGQYGGVNLSAPTSFAPNAQLIIPGNTRVGYEHAPMQISATESGYNPADFDAAATASNQADQKSLDAIVAERTEISGAVRGNFDVAALRALGAQGALAAVTQNFQTIGRLGNMAVTFSPAALVEQLGKYATLVQLLAEAGTGTPDYSVRDSILDAIDANNVLATAANPVIVQLGELTPERAAALTIAQYAITAGPSAPARGGRWSSGLGGRYAARPAANP